MATTLIKRTRIIGTNFVVYTAWAPAAGLDSPSTIRDLHGICHGKIGTDPDPTSFYHLAYGSKERIEAVALAYDDRRKVAYAAILEAYPEAAEGQQHGGEITVTAGG